MSPDPAMGETFLDGMLDESYSTFAYFNSCRCFRDFTGPRCQWTACRSTNSNDQAGVFQGVVFTDTITQEQFFADEIGLEVLFNNNGDSGNPNGFLAGEQYCAAIQGVPSRSGIYRISIDVAWATILTPFNYLHL